jgi:Uma2 family endonuclease
VGTTRRPASYEQIRALPEHVVGEIVDGELHVSPRPASPHAHAAHEMDAEISNPFQRGRGGPGGWWFLTEPELHFGAQVVVPDLAGWRRERMPQIPDVAYFELAPDWVCEVASPSTAKLDRTKKTRVYARAGVGHLWIVDPLARTLEVFRLEDSRWSLIAAHADEETVRAEPFDAVELALAGWWLSAAATPAPVAAPAGKRRNAKRPGGPGRSRSKPAPKRR